MFTVWAGLRGHSLSTDKQCPGDFAFTAEMAPDGTITSLRTDAPFRATDCLAVTDVSFSSGAATSTGFRVVMVDHALCRWPPLLDSRNPYSKDSDRTFTLVIDRRRGPLVP